MTRAAIRAEIRGSGPRAKDDEDAARGAPKDAPLAGALSAPIAAGSLEAALHAARSFHMRHPGDGDAKRVVEALELLMSQVWLGGDEDDPPYAKASACLESADLAEARAQYTAILRGDPEAERARRLALRVDVVRCALAGAPLPPEEDAEEDAAQVEVERGESTRVAGDGELPLSAFQFDDETVNLEEPLVPPAAFPDEPTRQLELGDYELIDEPAGGDKKETTRVAQPGELPIEQLRREMRREESDAELDLFLDEMESEVRPAPPAPPPAEEPSLELDIDDELEAEGSVQPTEVAPVGAPRRRTPSRSFGRPKEPEPAPGRSPSRVFARPEEDVLSPPPADEGSAPLVLDDEPALSDGSARVPFSSSAPPPPAPIPRADQLSEDPAHAPVATKEVALPAKGRWDIREPGSDEEAPPERPGVLDSWAGVRVYETEPATFEPGVEGMDADSWEDPTEVGAVSPEQQAEAAVAAGDLGEALRIYQDLATQSPDDQRLWDRVAEIARMLQERSGG